MKKILFLLCLTGCSILAVLPALPAKAQSFEAQQLLLDWQKLLQEKQLLTDLQSGYQILSKGYTAIRDLSKGNFDLHKAFLDGLLTVSPLVKNYSRVAGIVNLQIRILDAYRSAWAKFQQDPHFTPDELQLIGNVYAGLFNETTQNISTLTTILTDGQLRAEDAERLRQIDGLYTDMEDKYSFLQSFNNRTAILSLQRSADDAEYVRLKQWYGMTP